MAIEALLGRTEYSFEAAGLCERFQEKRILVTGAGGSIGSQLVRQIARFGPERMTLVDHHENSLFALSTELAHDETAPCPIEIAVASVVDRPRMERVMTAARPHFVLHAAAHKHVPIMETHPCEAVKNNIRGTRIMSELAASFGVERFLLISTDKAARPRSVMGATKRFAENFVRMEPSRGRRRGAVVRFGNVLGSSGSVTEVFASQVRRGGPVSITHADASRYFVSINEAVQFALLTAGMLFDHALYTMCMGEPVRIVDLAERFVRCRGYEPHRDIQLKISGLRRGEKVSEDVCDVGERLVPTEIAGIFALEGIAPNQASVNNDSLELERMADEGNEAEVRQFLKRAVPGYEPA